VYLNSEYAETNEIVSWQEDVTLPKVSFNDIVHLLRRLVRR